MLKFSVDLSLVLHHEHQKHERNQDYRDQPGIGFAFVLTLLDLSVQLLAFFLLLLSDLLLLLELYSPLLFLFLLLLFFLSILNLLLLLLLFGNHPHFLNLLRSIKIFHLRLRFHLLLLQLNKFFLPFKIESECFLLPLIQLFSIPIHLLITILILLEGISPFRASELLVLLVFLSLIAIFRFTWH